MRARHWAELLLMAVVILLGPWRAHSTVLVWTNTVGTNNWNALTNWSPNQVPAATDDVFITNSGTYTVTVNSAASINLLALGGAAGTQTLRVPSRLTLGAPGAVTGNGIMVLTAGGTLTGDGGLSVSGQLNWSGGEITNAPGVGPIAILADGELSLTGTGSKFFRGGTIVNAGAATWSAGTLFTGLGCVLSNAPGGAFDLTGDADTATEVAGGSRTIANAGLFRKTTGAGTNSLSDFFVNTGTVQVQSGTLSLGGGNSSGLFEVLPGATLGFQSGTQNLTAGSSVIGDGDFLVNGATVNVIGSFDCAGTSTLRAGTLNASNALNVATLVLNGGSLGGSGAVAVSGPMSWTSGVVNGPVTIHAAGGLSISGASPKFFRGGTIVNAAAATWSEGKIFTGLGCVLSNTPGGTFDLTGDADTDTEIAGGSRTIANAGLFRKTSGVGTNSLSDTFKNSGTLQVLSGTLSLGPCTQTAGLTLLTGGDLAANQPFRLEGGAFAGTNTLRGSITNNGTLAPGASPGALTVAGNYTQTTNGVFQVELADTNPGTGFDQLVVSNAARLAGTLNVTVSNGLNPPVGTKFVVLTAAARSGQFSAFTFPTNQVYLRLNYLPNGVELEVIPIPVSISPAIAILGSGQSQVFTASNGTPPYSFSLLTNHSGGSVDSFTGSYTAGPTNGVTDTVSVTDASNGTAQAAISVIPIERVWSGGAFPDTNWSSAGNWAGNVVPVSGDALVFPGTASGKTNFNDLLAETVFQSLRFSTGACNYRISGAAPLLLAGGIRCTNASFNPRLVVPVRLLADQAFDNSVLGPALQLSELDTDGHELTLTSPLGAGIGLSGTVSGSGSLRKRGSGSLDLGSGFTAEDNTYTGVTLVEGGALGIVDDWAFGSMVAGTTVSTGAVVRFNIAGRIVPEPLTLAGTLSSGIVSGNTWAGPILLASPDAVLAAETNSVVGFLARLRVTGAISGSGGFVKTGPGIVTLTNHNTYTGQTRVQEGVLEVEGLQSASAVTVVSNAVLRGSGQVGPLLGLGGRIEPGQTNQTGILQVAGALSLDAASTLAVRLNGTNAGANYDQLQVANGVALTNPALALTLGFTPTLGQTFCLISNASSSPVSGQFVGLAEGANLTVSNQLFRITYAGGDGNDVILTRTDVVAAPTLGAITLLGNGHIQLQGSGGAGLTYDIEANTDLAETNWLLIGTAPADGLGQLLFIDTNATLFPRRFYRALSP